MDKSLPKDVEVRIRQLEEEIKTISHQYEQQSKENFKKYRRVIDATSEGFLELDLQFNIIDYNETIIKLTGKSGDTLLRSPVEDLYDKSSVFVHFADKNHLSFEAVFNNEKGPARPLLYKRSILRDTRGTPNGYLVFLTELTELKQIQEDLKKVEVRYRDIYQNAAQGMYQCLFDGKLLNVNPAFAKIFGYENTTDFLRSVDNINSLYKNPDDRLNLLADLTRDQVIKNYEMEMLHREEKSVWVMINARLTEESDGLQLIEGILIDNTKKRLAQEQLHRSRERFRYLANHDSLTGLYNTRFLYKSLDKLITESNETTEPFSLVFLDMDNFKHIVDTYGHLNGSQALKEVAETIKLCLEKRSYGVSYGGDEFVLVLPQTRKDEALEIVEKVREQIKTTIYLSKNDLTVRMSASFGVAVYPDDAEDSAGLLALADEAMFHVKSSGKDAVAIPSDIT